MKLKKIASLMLAGIMAVSMLAGCKTASNNGNGGEGEGEGTQTSGYSAVMADAVSDKVKDMEYVTFQDNTADQTALNTSMYFVGSSAVESIMKNQRVPTEIPNNGDGWGDDLEEMVGYLVKELELDDENMTSSGMTFDYFVGNSVPNMTNLDVKRGVIYAVDKNVGINEAVAYVADNLSDELAQLDEESSAGNTTWYYEYVVSVSVANKTVGDNSANFILVTVDRTVTNA